MMTPRDIDSLADAIVQRLSGRLTDSETLLDVHEAAKFLNCSVATVERLIRDGQIPSIKVGRLRRFRKSDLLSMNEKGGNDE